jgi:hypothetical protein
MSKKQRAVRVQLPVSSGVMLRIPSLADQPEGTNTSAEAPAFDVQNLSQSGLGFRAQEFLSKLSVGSTWAGELLLDRQKQTVQFEVVRVHEGLVGVRYLKPSPTFLKTLESFFRAEIQAIQMVAVKRESETKDPEWDIHWYSGKNGFEVYFTIHRKTLAISKYTVSFFGCFLKGGEGLRFRAGDVTQSQSAFENLEVRMIFVRRVQRLLENIPELLPDHRQALVELILRDAQS